MFKCRMTRCLLFLFIIKQFNIKYASTSWPSLDISSVQLLGLFPDPENTSTPSTFSVHPRAMFRSAILLSHQYGITINDEFIGGQVAQTGGNVINAFRITCQTVTDSDTVGIVGPAYSREATEVAAFADRIGLPIISYSATDPDLSDHNAYPTFYRTVASDNAAAIAIGKLFVQYNWTSSIIIYQNDAYGTNGAKFITQAFNDIGVAVRQNIVFDLATKTIRGNLQSLLTSSSTRIVVLWSDPINTPLVIQIALDNNVLGPQFTWILSASTTFDSSNQTVQAKLIGMLTVEPVTGSVANAPTNTTLLNAAYKIWQQYEPETFPGAGNVDDYGVFAFDATWTLILSLQQLCSDSNNLNGSCTAWSNSSYCFDRRYFESSAFIDVINNIKFLGVSGAIEFSANVSDRIKGIYYVAQNSQRSANGITFVPVLRYSDPGDWDAYTSGSVIVWPGNSLVPPTDRPVLEGVTLRIGVIMATPFTALSYVTDDFGQNTSIYIGYIPDLIALLQYNMKFIPQLIIPPSTLTYNQIIQQLADGVYDMVMGDVTVTATRRQTVDFSNSIFDNSLRIITRKSDQESIDLFSYLRTFTLGLWLMLLVTCVVAAVLLGILERQENEALQNRSTISLAALGLWHSLGVIVGYGVDFHVRTAAGRLLTVGLYIVSIVFVATYTANLTSYLTVVKTKDLISSIDDIKNGKVPFNRIGIRLGTSIEAYYLREISHGVKNYYPLNSRQQQCDSLLSGIIDVTFMDIGTAEYLANNIYCNLTLVGAGFDSSTFGIVVAKQWIYKQDLDVNILLLRQSGQLDDLRSKWFHAKTCQDGSNGPTAMKIESLGGLFLTFAAISILSIFVFLWQNRYIIANYLSNLYRHRSKPTREVSYRPPHSVKIRTPQP